MLKQCPMLVGFDFFLSRKQVVSVRPPLWSTNNVWLLRRGSPDDGHSGQGSLKGWHWGNLEIACHNLFHLIGFPVRVLWGFFKLVVQVTENDRSTAF